MRRLLSILLLFSVARSQEPGTSIVGQLDTAQTLLFEAALSFYDGSPPTQASVRQIGDAIRRVYTPPDNLMPSVMRGHPGLQSDRENLSYALLEYEFFSSHAANPDTLPEAFRGVFYAFHHFSRSHIMQKSVSANRRVVLLFVASITCECMRRICDEYAAELIRLRREAGSGFDMVIVDSVTDTELLTRYEVGSIPAAVMFDGSQRVENRVDGGDHVRQRLEELLRKEARMAKCVKSKTVAGVFAAVVVELAAYRVAILLAG